MRGIISCRDECDETTTENMTVFSRRQSLKLVFASLLVVSGCASFTRESELDAPLRELRALLEGSKSESKRLVLVSIAERIEIRARDLVAEHREFVSSFDSLLREYEVTETQITQLIEAHARRRKWLRNDLLQLQDELHAAVSQEEWTKLVQVLNQTSKALVSYTLPEA